MDVALGVAITGSVARLALVGSAAGARDVLDQSVVDVADNPIEKLTETVVGTNRLLTGENHRLVATRLCWSDHPKADRLRQVLEDSGVQNIEVLSESQAATALLRAQGRSGAVLMVDDEAATLLGPVVGDEDAPPTLLAAEPLAGGDVTSAFDTLMARISDQPGAPREVYLVGASAHLTGVAEQLRDASTMRVGIPDDPTFALARGAAMAGTSPMTTRAPVVPGEPTTMIPPSAEFTRSSAQAEQLAYSLADDSDLALESEAEADFDDEAVTGPVRLSSRSLLISNAVIAFAVIGFASLAVAVAITIRPTAASEPVVGHQNAQPGKFMPLLPTQQQAPVPPPPADAPNAGFQGGIIPDANGYIPQRATPPGVGGTPAAPAPQAPAAPGVVPNPNVPIPVPIIIPYPGWVPPAPPNVPPTNPYTPATTPPTTPPTTHPTTPPTTQPHTTQPTTAAPPPSTKQTTVAPAPTHTQTQQTMAPKPVTPQQPVTPLPTHGHH